MALVDHLDSRSILLRPVVANKWQLLDRLVDAVVDAGQLESGRSEEAKAALHAREKSVSTGMENGIAVPHAAMPNLGSVIATLAILPDGIDFQSLDGKPAKIVVMLLVPKEEKVLHVRTLTEVARRLGEGEFRKALLACDGGAQAVQLWV
ncbi:MAG: PTS sugar transporter subunit IIA [Planctomycetota bacterium]|nr:MAG: PTS sugar transporter subunit IIA [Planctomycetota bacterium]